MASNRIKDSALPRSTQFHLKRYDKLVGKTLTGVCVDRSDRGIEPVIGLVFGETVAWIMCDEEGNGPGVLDIEGPK